MRQDDPAFAARLGGDQGRSIGQPGPGSLAQLERRFGEDLSVDEHVVRHDQAAEGALRVEWRQARRAVPGHHAAQGSSAAAQAHRQQAVRAALGQARSGKAQQQAAPLDPGRQPFEFDLGQASQVWKHQNRQLALQQLADLAAPQLGKGVEGALQVVELAQQWLRLFKRPGGDQAYGPPPPTFVQQKDGAGLLLVGDSQPGDLVAQLGRQVQLRVGQVLVPLEDDRRARHQAAVLCERQYRSAIFAGRAGPAQAQRQRDAIADGRQQEAWQRAVGVPQHAELA